MDQVEVISRVERRRRWSEAEKATLLAETDVAGATVAAVAKRHGVAESVLYNWRSARRAAAVAAMGGGAVEDLRFVPVAMIAGAEGSAGSEPPERAKRRRRRGGTIAIELPGDVRVVVEGDVDATALRRTLLVVKDVL